jgi:hypothetical protein
MHEATRRAENRHEKSPLRHLSPEFALGPRDERVPRIAVARASQPGSRDLLSPPLPECLSLRPRR